MGLICMEKQTKDFIFSFILTALSIYVGIGGYAIYRKVARPPFNITVLSISPGFMPIILAVALFFCSILLFLQSLKGKDGKKAVLKARVADISRWMRSALHDKQMFRVVSGILIIACYTYILLHFFPYWLASLLFLVGVMLYLRAGKLWKILLISLGSVGLIFLLFQVCFNASLP